MTSDTLKSLGYLKKSLKMSRKATTNNQKADGIPDGELKTLHTMIDILVVEIGKWEAKAPAAPVSPVSVPDGVAQPTPAAATISTVPLADDDLLTAP
jgi:hypothetical protein